MMHRSILFLAAVTLIPTVVEMVVPAVAGARQTANGQVDPKMALPLSEMWKPESSGAQPLLPFPNLGIQDQPNQIDPGMLMRPQNPLLKNYDDWPPPGISLVQEKTLGEILEMIRILQARNRQLEAENERLRKQLESGRSALEKVLDELDNIGDSIPVDPRLSRQAEQQSQYYKALQQMMLRQKSQGNQPRRKDPDRR